MPNAAGVRRIYRLEIGDMAGRKTNERTGEFSRRMVAFSDSPGNGNGQLDAFSERFGDRPGRLIALPGSSGEFHEGTISLLE